MQIIRPEPRQTGLDLLPVYLRDCFFFAFSASHRTLPYPMHVYRHIEMHAPTLHAHIRMHACYMRERTDKHASKSAFLRFDSRHRLSKAQECLLAMRACVLIGTVLPSANSVGKHARYGNIALWLTFSPGGPRRSGLQNPARVCNYRRWEDRDCDPCLCSVPYRTRRYCG